MLSNTSFGNSQLQLYGFKKKGIVTIDGSEMTIGRVRFFFRRKMFSCISTNIVYNRRELLNYRREAQTFFFVVINLTQIHL